MSAMRGMREAPARKPAPSILDAPVSLTHRMDDVKPARPMPLWPEQELDALQPSPASPGALGFSIKAEINQGSVDFRVSGKASAVTFEELEAACREQLPGVVLEHRTKWLQYTFDLWSHAGQCLYSIPHRQHRGAQAPSPASAQAAPAPGRTRAAPPSGIAREEPSPQAPGIT
ncbi:hypothetical protein [Variovorax sp. RA8]|uniref:hypothetical protein n=1 Tax=Variovorax sp. (strain JCM 16519 / RA8) TaxID=662548 RepID=UPI001315E318|nr:hypothetical protein [Variovorax sp. RA8]VTU44909.1 hypothetical protein RA8P2_00345 [Variovorax sp. RA8]